MNDGISQECEGKLQHRAFADGKLILGEQNMNSCTCIKLELFDIQWEPTVG